MRRHRALLAEEDEDLLVLLLLHLLDSTPGRRCDAVRSCSPTTWSGCARHRHRDNLDAA